MFWLFKALISNAVFNKCERSSKVKHNYGLSVPLHSVLALTCLLSLQTKGLKAEALLAFHKVKCDREVQCFNPAPVSTFCKEWNRTFESCQPWSTSLNMSSVAQEWQRWVSLEEEWLFCADVSVRFHSWLAGDVYEVWSCCFPAVEEDGSCEHKVEIGKWINAYDHEKQQLNAVVSRGGYEEYRSMFWKDVAIWSNVIDSEGKTALHFGIDVKNQLRQQ